MKNKTILIPTDFSENAQNAIHYAISMFDGENPFFILLNAYRITPLGAEEYFTEVTDFENLSKQGLEEVIHKIKKAFPYKSLQIETVTKLGYPVEAMEKITLRRKVDMVIMGTKGASGLKEVLIGSNTSNAIKTLPVPVLAVPGDAVYKIPEHIAFAADFKEMEQEVLMSPMMEIAKRFKSEILIIHVEQKGEFVTVEEALQGMSLHDYFRKIPHLFEQVQASNAAKGIEAFIKSHAVDMLVCIARKHKFWEKLFFGSVTERLAMHATVPLLALQHKE